MYAPYEKCTGRSGALMSPRTISAAKGLGPYIVLTDFSFFQVKQIEPCTSLLGASGTVSQTTSRRLKLPWMEGKRLTSMPLGMTKAETTALYTSVKVLLFPRGNWNNTSGSCTLRERWTPLHLASTQAGTTATNSILMTMVSVTKQRHLENIVWPRLHMKVRWSVFCMQFSWILGPNFILRCLN